MRRLFWSFLAWRRGVPTCGTCGRPKGGREGYYGFVCNHCTEAWAEKMRRRREARN